MTRDTQETARRHEAAELVQRILDSGWTLAEIAERVHASPRTVRRWWDGASAPFPVLLDALRQLHNNHKPRRSPTLPAERASATLAGADPTEIQQAGSGEQGRAG